MSYSLLVQFWILFNVPNSLIVQLGAKVLLNSWIQTNNVQEGLVEPVVYAECSMQYDRQRRKKYMYSYPKRQNTLYAAFKFGQVLISSLAMTEDNADACIGGTP